MRLFREPKGFTLVVGPWAARFGWGEGRFANGSRWWSGWHRWKDQPDY